MLNFICRVDMRRRPRELLVWKLAINIQHRNWRR